MRPLLIAAAGGVACLLLCRLADMLHPQAPQRNGAETLRADPPRARLRFESPASMGTCLRRCLRRVHGSQRRLSYNTSNSSAQS